MFFQEGSYEGKAFEVFANKEILILFEKNQGASSREAKIRKDLVVFIFTNEDFLKRRSSKVWLKC